jgi:hypothetical protein
VYTWGAGILGNGTNLFSSRPVLLDLENISLVAARGNTSVAIGNSIFMWGHVENTKALSPVKVNTNFKNIISVDVNSNHIVMASKDKVVLMGTNEPYHQPFYPHNPPLPDLVTRTEPVSWPILVELDLDQIQKVQLQGNQVFVLANGRVLLVNSKGTQEIPFKTTEPIINMHIGPNNAIFSTKSTVFVFNGIASRHIPKPKETSFFYRWFTRNDPVVDEIVISIVDAIKELEPETFALSTEFVSCSWDHFIAK